MRWACPLYFVELKSTFLRKIMVYLLKVKCLFQFRMTCCYRCDTRRIFMDDKLYALMNWPEIEALIYSEHDIPTRF